MEDFMKSQEERMKMIEENQAKIVTALTNMKKGNPEGAKGGFWEQIAKAVASQVLMPQDPLQKLARRSLLEDLLFGRTLRHAVLSSMGKKYIRKYTKDLEKSLEELEEAPEETEETESE